MFFSLPAIKNRDVCSIHAGVVCWTDPAGTVYHTSLKEWLDAVPPYVSTYPHGNKLADETAEAAFASAMSWWRAAGTIPEPVPTAEMDRLRAIEEAASSLLIRMDAMAEYEKLVGTYAGTQAGRGFQNELDKAKLDVALWLRDLRVALAK